jgi:hypothetical protein
MAVGYLLFAAGDEGGSKGSDLGIGLVTGGVIAFFVFGAEVVRDRLRLEAALREASTMSGLPPVPDVPPPTAP